MPTVVGVRFRKAGKIYYFDPGDLELNPGQNIIVETSRGLEFGEVIQGNKEISTLETVPIKPVKRVAVGRLQAAC